MRPGMRLGEALATCPQLVLVERDPAAVETAWEEVIRRLEDDGFAVEPVEPGCLYFDTRGVERLYGGVAPALKRALAAVGSAWDACAGAADRRFAALAAAAIARPGQALVVDDERTQGVPRTAAAHAPAARAERREELEQPRGQEDRTACRAAGQRRRRTIGAGRPARLEPGEGRGGRGEVTPRPPAAEIAERLEFPEAVGNELTLRRALTALLDRILARPERGGREIRKVALSARLVGGGSWRRTVTLREPTAERGRLRAALGPKLAELPAPVLSSRLELVTLAESRGPASSRSSAPEGEELQGRLREGLRQVRASAGAGAVATVVEVAPWSRIPEQRALLVPRD